jgi:hypothetical protein
MKNLQNELLEVLAGAEFVFQENTRIGLVNRFCLWTGLFNESMRKNLEKAGLGSFESMLKKAKRQGLINLVLDDETLHISIPVSMHSEEQLKEIEGWCDFEKL